MTADPLDIPAFLRRTDTAAERQRLAAQTARAPRLHTEPLIPAAPVSPPRVARARARISERRGRWYYTIRGGYTGGPFDTRLEAVAAADRAKKGR